jgi:hypothetical protein
MMAPQEAADLGRDELNAEPASAERASSVRSMLFSLTMRAHGQQQNDRQRHAQHPKQYSSAHDESPNVVRSLSGSTPMLRCLNFAKTRAAGQGRVAVKRCKGFLTRAIGRCKQQHEFFDRLLIRARSTDLQLLHASGRATVKSRAHDQPEDMWTPCHLRYVESVW